MSSTQPQLCSSWETRRGLLLGESLCRAEGHAFLLGPWRGVCGTEEERAGEVASMILLYVGTYNPLSLIAIKIGIESIGTY